MPIYWTAAFWRGLAERAIKTAAQAAVAFLATAQAGILAWDWQALASVVAGAAVLSVLTSLATPIQATAAPVHVMLNPTGQPQAGQPGKPDGHGEPDGKPGPLGGQPIRGPRHAAHN